MRWDGKTYKKSPTTGEDIPDESAQVPEEVYVNPRKAEWPATDYVIGNPPFIGAASMRRALGDGYVDTLRRTWKEVPESSDFVMYWWNKAADLARNKGIKQFGLITTNSLRQTFNRRVIERHMNEKKPLSLAFAIPDHPWVDSTDGAAVRIAMTVGTGGESSGVLGTLRREKKSDSETRHFTIRWQAGKLHSNLKVGANLAKTVALKANNGLGFRGVTLMGSGFWVPHDDPLIDNEPGALRQIINGRDLTAKPRNVSAIDFFGCEEEEAREQFPAAYQRVLEGVKPERDQSKRAAYRRRWWVFAEPRPELRAAVKDLPFYLATPMTAKHRFFAFTSGDILPDQGVIAVAIPSYTICGLLSSRAHILWALAMGGHLGVGNDPRYNNSRCFETFPFPEPDESTRNRIGDLARQLDTHRKRQQEKPPALTMTGMYNVLEKLRREEPLTEKEKEIHEQGLVSVLRELHDDLDRAVFHAYGWDDLAEKLVGRPGATTPWPEKPEDQLEAEEELLQRLVDLNHQRAAEEAKGKIRWLRPDYQAPEETAQQGELAAESADAKNNPTSKPANEPTKKLPWPKTLQAQIRAVRHQLATGPMDAPTLATRFKRRPEKSVSQVLDALTDLGMVGEDDNKQFRLRES
jgi:hypothetical protein